MTENVQKRISEVVAIEVLRRLTADGICLVVQTGDKEFAFADKSLANIDIVDLAKFLVKNNCPDKDIETILSKYEGKHEPRKQ